MLKKIFLLFLVPVFVYSETINLKNGGKLFKNREELLFNGKTVAKNSISTLDRVLHLLNIC